MYYYFNYSFLEDKLISHYKTNTLIQAIDCFGKDMHSNIYRIRDIILNKLVYFNSNEVMKGIELLNLNSDETIKCFFNVEASFEDKKDLIKYIKERKNK